MYFGDVNSHFGTFIFYFEIIEIKFAKMNQDSTRHKVLRYAPISMWLILHISNTLGALTMGGIQSAAYFLFTFSIPPTIIIVIFEKLLFPLYLLNPLENKRKIVLYLILEVCLLLGTIMAHIYVPEVLDHAFYDDFPMTPRVGVIIALTLSGVIMVASLQFNQFLSERRINEIGLVADKVKAELDVLKNQINPHFLFNTLNNIYGLAYMGNKKSAEMISKLSQMMRYMLNEGKEEKVPLLKEKELIESFLMLHSLKDESLNIDFYAEGVEDLQMIPPMILINFVENCFQHSDIDHNPKAWIKVSLEVNESILSFTTENSFEKGKERTNRTGIGINNSRKLLNGYYPNEHELTIDHSNSIHKVDLKIKL